MSEAAQKKSADSIGEHNFQEVADEAIQKYQVEGMVLDALFWGTVIGHYNAALEEARAPKTNAARPKAAVWEEAASIGPVIQVQKFSSSTGPVDVKALTMPEKMKEAVNRTNVGRVWRARIGRACRWYYGWSAEEAMRNALDAEENS